MTNTNLLEERNNDMQERGIADYTKAIAISFRDRKKVFFEVKYGDLVSASQDAYFATSAMELNHTRSDMKSGGQAQERLLNRKSLKDFYTKWDKKHLKSLTNEEYADLMVDIDTLKSKVPYVESTRFHKVVEFDREISNKKVKKGE